MDNKKSRIDKLILKIIHLFQDEIPQKVMETPEGSKIMYDTCLNLLRRMASVLDFTKEETLEHLGIVFDGISEKPKPKKKEKVLN